MTSEIFYELKNPGDEQAVKFKEFIEKVKQIKLNGVNATQDSLYKVGSLKYFKAECPSLGELGNRDHLANLRKRFDRSIGELNPEFNKDLFSDKLEQKLAKWAEENPQYGDAGFFNARGIDAPAKAFAAYLLLLHEEGYLNDDDINNGEIIAIQREPQKSNGGNLSTENQIVSLDSRPDGPVEGYFEKLFSKLFLNKNVIVEGVAGSGKSHLLGSLRRAFYKQEGSKITYWVAPEENKKDAENEKPEGFSPLYGKNGECIEVVVFHPSTSYEEFVSGIRPNFSNQGEIDFVTQEGTFVQMCNRAAANPDKNFLLFIDEINRANTARVFGDLMLVLEKSKRKEFTVSDREGAREKTVDEVEPTYVKDENRFGALYSSAVKAPGGDYVRLQTSIYKTVEGEDEPIEFNKLVVPVNLHVLGTMNTTDRSVGTIDLALRRRFHWITQEPMNDRDELLTALELSGDKDKTVGFVADWFIHANEVLGSKVGPDARLGHAYFFGKDGDVEAIAEALLNQLKEIAFTFNIDEKVLWGVSKDGKFNKDNPVYCLESKEHIGAVKVITQKEKKQLWGVQNEGEGLGRRPVVKKLNDKDNSSMTDGGNSNSENEGSESTVSDDGQGDQ